ncbi:MAG: hypothetical protein RET84_01170 [Pseudomonadota bacterium]|nr:hypothetical protein [Pseudomonadota bacterium]MDQ7998718.1 hypothetical protein [Pseudomonadota bacterium]
MATATNAPAPMLRVLGVEAGVRDMHLRLPFKFGAVVLTRCPQLFVRATVEVAGLGTATGFSAEMMVPRWFDKRPARSQADNVQDLQASLARAVDAYSGDAPATAFGLFERHYQALMAAGAARGETALSSAYGQAVLDRAVLDALCRAAGCNIAAGLRRNIAGLADTPLAPELAGFDWPAWLAARRPAETIEARHTVGMLDALDADPDADPAALPVHLPDVVRRYGHRSFKVKLGGDPAADIDRLDAVLSVLDAIAPGHRFSLDGNEQYAGVDPLADLFERLRALPRLAARPKALLYIEQPLARDADLDAPLRTLDAPAPLLLDEGDGTLDAFPRAVAQGWQGVSSKGCKGVYKALIHRARCERSGGMLFMSAEDLTCQAGLAVQQDLAIAALLGLTHCERNGHHYVDGFGPAPRAEAERFAAAHPDLYRHEGGQVRLAIADGRLQLGSLLAATGFAHAADPHFDHLQPLERAAELV